MADDELYLANLDEFVNDEDKIVTYKWLSRTLSVPVNKAKQMLYAFVQKQKTSKAASHLNITYIVGGRCSLEGEIVHRYVITQDENLEETKKSFSLVTSLHIYSIQKCKLKDSNSLYTVDYDIQQQHNSESNRWSHVYCSAAVPLADKGVNRGTQRINGLADGEKCPSTKMVNGSCESGTTQKGTSNLASEQKGKIPGPKSKKGQMSALESMFTAKPSSSKAEKSKSEKPQNANDAGHDEPKVGKTGKTDSNKVESIKSSFFGKATTVKKASEKPGTTERDQEVLSKKTDSETILKKQNDTVESLSKKKRGLPSEDEEEDPLPSEISKAIKLDTEESKVVKEDKKKIQKKEEKEAETTKSRKAGKKKAVINEPDEELEMKPKKRRKRTRELPKEDSSDDEQAVTNDEPDKKVPSDQGSSRSVSPLPQQQPRQTENGTARRRKRKRQLKSKTYMNDEGFMVTEKVWGSDSTDASDDDLQITNDPPVNEKRPSPAKKTIKKSFTEAKNKSTKQASLTSFFKKS